MTIPNYVKSPHVWFGDGPFRTASSFSSPLFIDNFLRGRGGHWLDYERQFIARLQKQTDSPIRGRRVPTEADAWADRDPASPDHPFFGNRDTADLFWDYNALARGQRPGLDRQQPALTVHMQKYLLIQIGLARKFDMRTEFVIDWTLKHANLTIGWGTIGHCIRQLAAFLRLVHTGEWDTGVDGNAIGHPTNEKANDRIHEMFDEVKGPMAHLIAFELHNEWDAHSQRSWANDGMTEAQALHEVNLQLQRTKRIKDGVPEQWREGACWVSHGGRDTIEYDPTYADAVAIHPSRPGTRVGDRFHHLRKHGKPIYANEILHYIPRDLWWTVDPEGWFRPGSSTADMNKRFEFVDEMLADGMWVDEHGLTNMSNGRWKDADHDFSEMPLDPYELARGARSGAVHPPPPAPEEWPPEDQSLRPYDRYVVAAYASLPRALEDIDEKGRRDWNNALEDGLAIHEMDEMFLRSPEFEDKNTGPWDFIPKVEPPEPPPVDPTPPEPPSARPQDYIQWSCAPDKSSCKDRHEEAKDIKDAYTVWRGERDFRSLLRPEGQRYLKGGDRALLPHTAEQIQDVIDVMLTVDKRGQTLQHRILTEKHRNFDSDPSGDWHRSQVRKAVAADMRRALEEQTEIYTEIASYFPAVPECDNITCKIANDMGGAFDD